MTDVGIAVVFPDLLGTYGDGGNATVLAQRLRWRGIGATVTEIHAGDSVPESCEIYVLGGGEDEPQSLAADQLMDTAVLNRAVDRGAVVFAVCAGLQVIGRSFLGPDGRARPGVGLIDVATGRTAVKRAVGELVVEPGPDVNLPVLTGYENHAGVTSVGPDARPLGTVVSGVGNGDGSGTEGAVAGKVLGTYLHGPALARNPALADLLLGWVAGDLAPLDDSEPEALRLERLQQAKLAAAGTGRRWWPFGS